MWKKIMQWFGLYPTEKDKKISSLINEPEDYVYLDKEQIARLNKTYKDFCDERTKEDKAAGTWPYAAPRTSRVNSSGSSFNHSAPSPAPTANRYDSPPTDNFTSGLVVGYMASSISSSSSSRYDSDSCSSSSSYSDSSSSCDSGSSSTDW